MAVGYNCCDEELRWGHESVGFEAVAFMEDSFEQVQYAEGGDRMVGLEVDEDKAAFGLRGRIEEEHRGRRRESLALPEHRRQYLVESMKYLTFNSP
jgi:hypothetical protein